MIPDYDHRLDAIKRGIRLRCRNRFCPFREEVPGLSFCKFHFKPWHSMMFNGDMTVFKQDVGDLTGGYQIPDVLFYERAGLSAKLWRIAGKLLHWTPLWKHGMQKVKMDTKLGLSMKTRYLVKPDTRQQLRWNMNDNIVQDTTHTDASEHPVPDTPRPS